MATLHEQREYMRARSDWLIEIEEGGTHEDISAAYAEVERTAAIVGVVPGTELPDVLAEAVAKFPVDPDGNYIDPQVEAVMAKADEDIRVLKADFPDLLDADGNLIDTDHLVDGSTRLVTMPVDRKRASREVLEAQLAALNERKERNERRRARLSAYAERLQAIEQWFATEVERLNNEG